MLTGCLGAIFDLLIGEGVNLIMHKLGCLGIIISVLLIGAGGFFIISEDVGDPIFESLFCAADETFTRSTRPSFDTGGEFVNFSCQNTNGDLKRVDGQVLLVVFIPLIPLFISISLLIIGTIRRVDRATGGLMKSFMSPVDSGLDGMNIQTQSYTYTKTIDGDVPDLASMSVQDLMDWAETEVQDGKRKNQPNQALTLQDKLRQLQSAYDEGLIDRAEFDRRKEAILDDLVGD